MSDLIQGKNILVVDDDPDILSTVSTLLSDEGANIESANDGDIAIEKIESFSPDLIVLDAMLPKRSGFLILEKIKGPGKKGQKPYVVMITGNEGKRHQTWAESLGVDSYINKPFRLEKLKSTVEALLERDQ